MVLQVKFAVVTSCTVVHNYVCKLWYTIIVKACMVYNSVEWNGAIIGVLL